MNRKHILATLTCLMMFSAFMAGLPPTQGQEWTGPRITLHAVRVNTPGWGYFGGYFIAWEKIEPALKKIGIDLVFWDLDIFAFEDQFYDYWNLTGAPPGWDLAMREWWLTPTSFIWFDEVVLASHVPEWNVMPYLDEKADSLVKKAVSTLDPTTYKTAMKFWQREFMHNPPVIGLYYAEMMAGQAIYLDGYDNTVWFYNPRELRIDTTKFEEVKDFIIDPDRADIGSETLMFGLSEPVYTWNPFHSVYYTEEVINTLTLDMLYRNEREHQNFPTSGDFLVYPSLAADFPAWYEASEIYPADYPEADYPDYMVARIPLRQGVYWSDGVEFNATDVAFTINGMLQPGAKSYARADYKHIIVEARDYNKTTVDLITYGLRYDLAGYLAHGWGWSVLPWHQFVKWGAEEKYGSWGNLDANWDPVPESAGGAGFERLGPYVPVYADMPTGPTLIKLQRFDVYVGPGGARKSGYPSTPWFWNLTELPPYTDSYETGRTWGWGLPKKLQIHYIPDDTTRFLALDTLKVDLIDYPIASRSDWEALAIKEPLLHKVYTVDVGGTPYPALHPLWFNLQNPVLSNRYVRLAIAHAIPYQEIHDAISEAWGIANVIPGRTFINPWMEAFDPTVPPFSYDIAKAQQYMWMYWNSLDETTWGKRTTDPYTAVAEAGHMGDHDLSGKVSLADYPIWVERFGSHPSEYEQISYPIPWTLYTFPYIADPMEEYWPGNDVDPDNNNNNHVYLEDFDPWASRFGTHYP